MCNFEVHSFQIITDRPTISGARTVMSPSSTKTNYHKTPLTIGAGPQLDFVSSPGEILVQSHPPEQSLFDVLNQIQMDMAKRWGDGQPVFLEEYHSLLAQHAVSDGIWMTLIRLELKLQLESGQTPMISQYAKQFPHLLNRIQSDLNDLLENFEIPSGTKQVVVRSSDIDTKLVREARSTNSFFPKIPGYEIQAVLGRGGMGVVYKARQIGLNRIVALKMILSDTHIEEDDRLRFLQEAEAVATLQHPNIVQIYEIGEHEGKPFFSLEYIEGGTLADLCQGQPQPVSFAAEIVATIADAVHKAHQANIVHRDLKPSNILLGTDDLKSSQSGKIIPKITDFGLAKRLDSGKDLTATGVAAGTPVYMAPEQVTTKRGAISPVSDVWALGVILYEMMTGRPPFLGESPVAIMNMVASSSPLQPRQLQPKLPRDLETICLKCLEKSPQKRYGSAAELAEDLQRFLAGRPIRARRVNAIEHFWRWTHRNPVIASLSLGSAFILVVGIILTTVLAVRAHESAEQAKKNEIAAGVNERDAISTLR